MCVSDAGCEGGRKDDWSLPVPTDDFPASFLVGSKIREGGVHQRMVLLMRDSEDVVEFLLVDFAHVEIAVLEDEIADPIGADGEGITLAVLVLRIARRDC